MKNLTYEGGEGVSLSTSFGSAALCDFPFFFQIKGVAALKWNWNKYKC